MAASATNVLAVSAHPDDAEFFAGGTLAQLAAQGARVVLVVCTDGSRGGRGLRDPASVREREQAAAAKVLGVSEVVALGFEDGRLEPSERLRERLVESIRRHRPEIVLGHDPRTFFSKGRKRAALGHSDHRASGEALLDAVYPRSGSPNFYPGLGGEPWTPRELWLFDCQEPDHVVDVTEGFPRKLDALRAHASQNAAGGGLLEAAERMGAALGSRERPAEAFLRLVIG